MKINNLFNIVSKQQLSKVEKTNIYEAIRLIITSKSRWEGKNCILSMYENMDKIKALLEECDFDSEGIMEVILNLDSVKNVLIENGVISESDTDDASDCETDATFIEKTDPTIVECVIRIPTSFTIPLFYVAILSTLQIGISAYLVLKSTQLFNSM